MGGLKEKEEKEGWMAEDGLCLQQQKEIWALAFQNQVWMKGCFRGSRAALDAECLYEALSTRWMELGVYCMGSWWPMARRLYPVAPVRGWAAIFGCPIFIE